ncbi:MAG: PVC-type heme-binding CxxCH protein, partial [Tepidisphaeraceae bacterium]
NYQARVNSLALGLDNWVHGANGLLGGVITGADGKTKLDIRGHDFRFRPPGGPMETVGGLTQQGRARDDWGRWFGCENSNALLFYPHEERYYRRNPHAPSPPPIVIPPGNFDVARIYPISQPLERYNHPESANRVTAACGLGVYRDTLLGDEYLDNTFTCEPVHNLVHRLVTEGDGAELKRRRADDERDSEFLASTDHWFRPVQARTGPDGALYVVDMYRFLIEHPRWIPAERLAQLDVRAGASMGRIYRVRAAGTPLRAMRDLTKLSGAALAVAMDTPNGTERDRVHIELLQRRDETAVATLEKIAAEGTLPQVRLQAMCALDGLGALTPAQVARTLEDGDAHVRKHAVRLCENLLAQRDAVIEARLQKRVDDPSPLVRRQLALTRGEWDDPRAGNALATLAKGSLDDADLRAAVLSSAGRHCGPILAAVMAAAEGTPGRDAWIAPLVATAAASSDEKLLAAALAAVLPAQGVEPGAAHFAAVASLFDALDRRKSSAADLTTMRDAAPRLAHALVAARRFAADDHAPPAARVDALKLLGRGEVSAEDLDVLCRLAGHSADTTVRAAAMASVARQSRADVATRLLGNWQRTSPAARSEIINLLLGREEWTAALLAAVKAGAVLQQEISLTDRQRLAESSSESVRQLAAAVLPQARTETRAKVLTQYASVASLTGAAASGAEVFAKNCAACHALGGVGNDVGPGLVALRDKDTDYFVKNILDPNAIVEPRFVNYTVVLKDRRVLAGIIKSESATSLALSVGAGVIETVNRGDVKDLRALKVSMMPEGLEAAITPQQMADLVAYLRGAESHKKLSGNEPALITQGGDGTLILPAAKAEIFGGPITLESEFGNIGWWNDQNDHVAWAVQVNKPGEFDVHLDYACADDSAGNAYTIGFGTNAIAGSVKGTGGDWSGYRQTKAGQVRLAAGPQHITVRPVGPVRNALMDLRTIALTPAGTAPKWTAAARAATSPPTDNVNRDAPSVARFVLNPANSDAAREAAIDANPQFAPELIDEMTRELRADDAAEEYRRIPWI